MGLRSLPGWKIQWRPEGKLAELCDDATYSGCGQGET